MAPYNLTQVIGTGNETSMLTFTQGVNTVLMDGMLGAVFLAGLSIVILSSFYFNSRDFGASILATSFISFSMSLALVAMHLLSEYALIFTGTMLFISVITVWGR